jgi:hypothetical protein
MSAGAGDTVAVLAACDLADSLSRMADEITVQNAERHLPFAVC